MVMSPRALSRTIAAVVGLLLWHGPAFADVAGLLDDVVAAYGGGATPTAIHERGTTESLRRGLGPVERWWQAPDRFRIEIQYPGATESRLMRGREAWQQGQPATPAFHGAVVLQAARMALPWRLRDNAAQVSELGATPPGNVKQLRTLEWRVQDGIRVFVEIDPETRLILRSRGVLTINDSSMEFATAYENYRLISGRRVAMTERHFAMGQYIGSTTLESVEFPDTLPAPTFDPGPATGLTARLGREGKP